MALPVSVEQVIEALEHIGDNGFFEVFDTLPLTDPEADPTFTWTTRDTVDGA